MNENIKDVIFFHSLFLGKLNYVVIKYIVTK